MSAEKARLALLRKLAPAFGRYLSKSEPLEKDVHERIEASIKMFNQALNNADNGSNSSKDWERIDSLFEIFMKSGANDIDSFATYYIEGYIFPLYDKVYKDKPVVELEIKREEENTVNDFKNQFKGTVSIASNLDKLEALDYDHPLKIPWVDLIRTDVLFIVDKRPVPYNDYSSLSYEEFLRAFELEKKLSSAWDEVCLSISLDKYITARNELLEKYNMSDSVTERANIRFEIEELDRKFNF